MEIITTLGSVVLLGIGFFLGFLCGNAVPSVKGDINEKGGE